MKKPILLDGPMGTEIERRGGDTSLPLWSARNLMTSPEMIIAIHKDFIKNGAEVITTNTFRTQERTLSRAGFKDKGEQLSKLAAELAREAKQGTFVRVAGSIAPLEDCYSPHLVPLQKELDREHGDMAKWLYESDIDLFLIETMNLVREAKSAVVATSEYDIPVWLSFTCDDYGNILGGERWTDVFRIIDDTIEVLMVNCSTPSASVKALEFLYEFKNETGTKIGLYPNYLFDLERGKDLLDIRKSYLGYFDQIMELEPDVIGTCCGAIPEDTKIIADLLKQLKV